MRSIVSLRRIIIQVPGNESFNGLQWIIFVITCNCIVDELGQQAEGNGQCLQ